MAKRLLIDEGRDYRRYRPDSEEKIALAEENKFTDKGLQWVLSSNVSAVGTNSNDLIIRFHNGSIYSYPGLADKYRSILTSNSKGKWVWRNLRRKNAPYQKLGRMPLKSDYPIEDDEIFQYIERQGIRVEEPQVLDSRDVQKEPKIFNIKKTLQFTVMDDILETVISAKIKPTEILTKINIL